MRSYAGQLRFRGQEHCTVTKTRQSPGRKSYGTAGTASCVQLFAGLDTLVGTLVNAKYAPTAGLPKMHQALQKLT